MRKQSVPGSGGVGSCQGDPKFNKHLMKPWSKTERNHQTADPGVAGEDGYPSMYDLARSMTTGKWGKSAK